VRAGLEVLDDLVGAPRAEARALVADEARGEPAFALAAFEAVFLLDAPERVLGTVAGAAVAEAFHEIGAAIPLRRLPRVRLERARLEEEGVPSGDGFAHRERPRKVRRLRRLLHRRDRIEVRLDREHVVAAELREPRIRERGIEMLAVRADAVVHRLVELLVGPLADAGFLVRRDVGRIDRAERRGDRAAAGEGLALVVGM